MRGIVEEKCEWGGRSGSDSEDKLSERNSCLAGYRNIMSARHSWSFVCLFVDDSCSSVRHMHDQWDVPGRLYSISLLPYLTADLALVVAVPREQ